MRPEKVSSSFTVASSNDVVWPQNAERTPSDIVLISASLRSSPASTPQSIALTGPDPVARSGERASMSLMSRARSGLCDEIAANLPRPAFETRCRMRSASSLM